MRTKPLWIFLHIHKTGGTTFNAHLFNNFKKSFIHLDSRESQIEFNKLSPTDKNKIKIITGHEIYYGIHKLIPGRDPKYIIFLRDPAERLVSQYNHHMSQVSENKIIPFEKWYENYPKNEITLFLNQRYNPFIKKIQRSTPIQKIIGKITTSNLWRNIRYPLKILQSKLGQKKKLEKAKEFLDRCWFIGITENLDDDLKFLCKKMGLPLNWKNMRVTGKIDTWKNDFISQFAIPAYKKFMLDEKTRQKIYEDNPLDMEIYEYAKKLNKKEKLI